MHAISKKAEKQMAALLFETDRQNKWVEPEEKGKWRWANTPICKDETVNLLKDLARLCSSRKRHNEICARHGIEPAYSNDVVQIVQIRVDQRIALLRADGLWY